MASIEKRVRNGTVSYRARYRDPTGRQRVKTFRRKVDAEKYLALIEAAKLRGTWTDPAHGKITLAEWLETWWGSAADLRPSTVARDRAYLNSLVLPRFGTTPLAAITQPDVQAWVAQLTARGFAPATVVKAYQLLGRTLTAAVNADMIPRSPCRAVRLPRIEREEMRFLNPAEVARLADAIGPRYRALVLLGAYGGLRMGELAGLRRGRVDLLRGRSMWPRSSLRSMASSTPAHPRPGPGGAASGCRASWWRSWPPTWGRSAQLTRTYSPPRRAACCGLRTSASRCGFLPCARPAWRRCARMTFATRRWRCGLPLAPTPRRSASEPVTPPSASRWTDTATCSRAMTPSCATAWTRCTPKAFRRPSSGARSSRRELGRRPAGGTSVSRVDESDRPSAQQARSPDSPGGPPIFRGR